MGVPQVLHGISIGLLVLEEVAARLAAPLGRTDLAPPLLLCCAPACRPTARTCRRARLVGARGDGRGRTLAGAFGVDVRVPREPSSARGQSGRRLSRAGCLGVARALPRPSLAGWSSSFLFDPWAPAHAGRELGLLGPGPGPLAVLGLAGDLAILEIAHLLRADLAVLRIRDRRSCRARRAPAGRRACRSRFACSRCGGRGARHLQRLVDPDAALAHAVRRLGGRLAGQAGVELIAAVPDPGLLAARGPAADLAVGDGAEVGLAASHIRRGGSFDRPPA